MAVDIRVGHLRLVSAQSHDQKLAALQTLYDAARKSTLELGEDLDRARSDLAKARAELEYERTIGRQKYFDDRYKNLFIYMDDLTLGRERLSKLVSMFPPHKAEGFKKVRLGRPHDGGYVTLDDFDVDAVLSMGISDDVSWDLDTLPRGSFNVHQYDHTIDGAPVKNQRLTFYKEAIGTGKDGTVSIGEALRRANVTKPASAIIKIDIDHAEWPAFATASQDDLSNFAQIVGEFHGFDEFLDDGLYDQALKTFTNISKQFRLVHVHGNNYGSQIVLGSKLLPRTLEMTFANIQRYNLTPSDETFPTPLDMPNRPDKPEHILDNFTL